MLQGPDAEKLLGSAGLASSPAELKRFEHGLFSIHESEVMIARTSYSGEDGFEIFAGPEDAKKIWKMLVALGATPVGFDAIDIARIEAGLLFFGKDMTGAETPTELGLDFIVDFSKRNFRGKAALIKKAQKPRFKTVGLALDGVTPFFGRASVWMDGVLAGSVSSYAFSEWLGKTVAIAQIKPELAINGREICVVDDGSLANEGRKGVVCPRQFYTNV
jgi:aminomethyltransferase